MTEKISAQRALELGLISEVLPREALLERAAGGRS
jgi:enoyl-CoA hydratase/carnithine racemase